MRREVQLFYSWCLPAFVIGFLVSFVLVAGFIPPPSPADSAPEIAAFFQDNTTRIRIGMFLSVWLVMPMLLWAVGITVQTMRGEGRYPLLGYAQLACIAMGTFAGVIDVTFWAVAAFRPDLSPETLRTLNDLAWLTFEFTTPPFSVWALLCGVSILLDESREPVFPRWAGYLSVFVCFGFASTDLAIFFKTGPFAWTGLLALYVPLTIFFIWLIVLHVLNIKAMRRDADVAAPQLAATARQMPVLS